jgi:exosome complex component RRP46
VRPPSASISELNRLDGSARFAFGSTQVLAAVLGPAEVKPRHELLDRATLEIVFKPASGLPTYVHKALEHAIRGAAEHLVIASLHPRTRIQIVVQAVQDDGGLLAASLNAATLALMDAGVPLSSTLAAVAVALDRTGQLLLDPNAQEEAAAAALFTFAFNASLEGVVVSRTSGAFAPEQYLAALELARSAADHLLAFFRLTFSHKYQRYLLTSSAPLPSAQS